jgi:hypothetical protein
MKADMGMNCRQANGEGTSNIMLYPCIGIADQDTLHHANHLISVSC